MVYGDSDEYVVQQGHKEHFWGGWGGGGRRGALGGVSVRDMCPLLRPARGKFFVYYKQGKGARESRFKLSKIVYSMVVEAKSRAREDDDLSAVATTYRKSEVYFTSLTMSSLFSTLLWLSTAAI